MTKRDHSGYKIVWNQDVDSFRYPTRNWLRRIWERVFPIRYKTKIIVTIGSE